MTCENNNGYSQIQSPMFASGDDSESEIDDFVPHEPDTVSDKEECLANSLVDWVSKFNIPQNAATALLHILRPLHPSLPSDAQTLMHTPRNFSIKQIPGGGEYVHFGIRNGIEQEAQLPQRNSASAAHTCAADALFLCGSCIGIGTFRS